MIITAIVLIITMFIKSCVTCPLSSVLPSLSTCLDTWECDQGYRKAGVSGQQGLTVQSSVVHWLTTRQGRLCGRWGKWLPYSPW